jgi:hypothetical protein
VAGRNQVEMTKGRPPRELTGTLFVFAVALDLLLGIVGGMIR